MDKIKKGLGRGLSSLIGETKVEVQKNLLPVSDLVPNKYQPRKNFDEANLEDLTNSIKERGMIQPIIVRKSNKNIDLTISSAKPPIFWKDKEITKQQIYKWTPENIKQLIYRLNEIELLVKKNINNSINLITDFILDQSSSNTNS